MLEPERVVFAEAIHSASGMKSLMATMYLLADAPGPLGFFLQFRSGLPRLAALETAAMLGLLRRSRWRAEKLGWISVSFGRGHEPYRDRIRVCLVLPVGAV